MKQSQYYVIIGLLALLMAGQAEQSLFKIIFLVIACIYIILAVTNIRDETKKD